MKRTLLATAIVVGIQLSVLSGANGACTAGTPLAGAAETTPTSAFTDNGNGTVTHALTGLIWKKCLQGQSGASCAVGNATPMTWRAALAAASTDTTAGYTDWRLPNVKELGSIIEYCGYYPAINRTVFPNSTVSFIWTGTTYKSNPTMAYAAVFYNGGIGVDLKSEARSTFVRFVRGGRSADVTDAQTVQPGVVEYLNTVDFPNSPGGHFFYSSDAAEQAAVDSGAAGHFARTGRLFLKGGTSPVCRFYGSMSPGPNSHFFTVDVNECNALRAAQVTPMPATVQQWNYEGLSYSTTPVVIAANGTRSCPANTMPLYRAYNNAYSPAGVKNPWDSNHRFTPQLTDIAAMVSAGWRDEGIVFCTPN